LARSTWITRFERACVGDARDPGEFVLDCFRKALELGEVAAEDLDRVLAFHAGDRLLDIVLDVLREVEIDADEFAFETRRHLFHKLRLGQPVRPFLERLEGHEKFSDEGSVRIGGILAAALLGDDRAHGRIAGDDLADLVDSIPAGVERDRGRQQGADPEIALFKFRQEFGAEAHAEAPADDKKRQRDHGGHARVAYGKPQDVLIDLTQLAHEVRFDLVDFFRQQQRRHHGGHCECRDHGADQRVGVSPRHRPENLAFHALHREQRQEGSNRDDDREEDRLVDFDCGGEDPVQPVAAACIRWMTGGVMRQVAENVFHHDDGAIDDDAQIDGADRQQIGGIAAQDRNDDGKQQCNRDGRGYDQRAAQIAEKDPLNEEDEGDAEQHIVHHGAHGDRDQVAAIVIRLDLHARWQAAVAVDALDGRTHARHHIHRAFEFLHQDDAEQDVVLVVARGNSQSGGESDLVMGDIRQHDGQAALLAHHDIVDVADRAQHADSAHVDRLFAHGNRAPADIGVAGGNGIDDLRQSEPIGPHAVEIDFGLVFLGLAAQWRDVGDPGNDAKFAFDHPVLQRLELDQVHSGRTLELIAQDFADAAGRRNHRRDDRRQRGVLQPVGDLLAHEIIVTAIFELQADKAEREHRVRADVGEAGRAGDRNLERNGDIALDFLR
jgi:hypothetical protein